MTTESAPAPAAAAAAPAPAPAAAAAPSFVLFLGKIAPTCKKEDIRNFVSPVATIKRLAIRKVKKFRLQFAFVQLESEEALKKAVEALNGKELGGSAVVAEIARRPFPRNKRFFRKNRKAAAPAPAAAAAPANAPAAATEEKKKPRRGFRRGGFRPRRAPADTPLTKDVAYVGNLPYIVDEEGMKDIFEGCAFVEARVVRRARDNRSKGFGFVTFANEEDRAKAIKVADGSVVEGRKIHVSPARERVEKPKEVTVTAPASN
jgi:RNA recognition motif-containing protein